jgi:hypothetical protein
MIPRHLESVVREALEHFPVVLLLGARQVGKSTLAQSLSVGAWPAHYVTLDDRTTLDAVLRSPDGYLQEAPEPLVIDEVQRAPDLLRALKLVVDRKRAPGRFLLTGSANVLTLSVVSETLAGRIAVLELMPFSWAELRREAPSSAVDALFEATTVKELMSRLERQSSLPVKPGEVRERVLAGGYPPAALMTSGRARQTWFESYRQTYIERDLRNLADLAHVPEFGRLLTTLALRTGGLLNLSELSRDLGVPTTTLRRYFNILTQTFQIFLVHPYSANVRKRLVKTPKLYLTDTGFACHLAAAERWETLERQERAGALVETWAALELRKLLSAARVRTDIWYWRTHGGREVDFILERGGEVAGVEVKLHEGFKDRDLAGLEECAQALGRRWRFGVLLHGGREMVPIDDRTLAIPLSTFFAGAARGRPRS